MDENLMTSRYISKSVKDTVKKRDGQRCRLCGKKSEYMEFDHLTPFSKGAPATVENIQLICRKCNLEKKNHTPKCEKCLKWIPYGAEYCQNCGATQKNIVKNFKPERKQNMLVYRVIGVLLIILVVYLYLKR